MLRKPWVVLENKSEAGNSRTLTLKPEDHKAWSFSGGQFACRGNQASRKSYPQAWQVSIPLLDKLSTYPKIMLSKICEQAIWTKASQFCGFLHQRVATLRRFDNNRSSLDYPTSGGKARFTRNGTFVLRLIAPAPMLAVGDVIMQTTKTMHIFVVIAFICAKVLFAVGAPGRQCEQSDHRRTTCHVHWRP